MRCVDAIADLVGCVSDSITHYFMQFVGCDHRRLLEADNLDRASRSLKTNIKFSKEVRLPKN